jgi:hypothetical protein
MDNAETQSTLNTKHSKMDNAETQSTLNTKHRMKTNKTTIQLRKLKRWATWIPPKQTNKKQKTNKTIKQKQKQNKPKRVYKIK